MCYSAQIWQEYRKYVREFNVKIDIATYIELFWNRLDNDKIRIPKAMELAFCTQEDLADESTRPIREAIESWQARQTLRLEQDLFKQRKRLADAQRTLLTKTTKAATETRRIASTKIDWTLNKLADLRRTEPKDEDARIYPGSYAPVMVMENGQRVLKPMRYQCRPAGRPASYDSQYPGTYNARRDNLEDFWKGQFGHTHGLMVVNSFYEHVARPLQATGDGQAGREMEKVILEFKPRPREDMLVACLWSHWRGEGEPDLYSFAAITDTPPPEVAAAGHDRCIIPIKAEHIDAWLNPDPARLSDLYAILDDRQRPYYEHRLAA
jgi:putative SOS response-associated peptidase YedK